MRFITLEKLTSIAFLILTGMILYLLFYPFEVVTLNSIGIDKSEYCRGDFVKIDINFTKHMDSDSKVEWFIVDGIIFKLDSPGITRPAGENHFVTSKQIPFSILPGEYTFRAVSVHTTHPLRQKKVYSWDTPKFIVLEEERCSRTPDENLGFPDPENKPL